MLTYEKASKLEKGDILIALSDDYSGSNSLKKYTTLKVEEIEKEAGWGCGLEVKITASIESGNWKGETWSRSIGEDDDADSVVKQNEESIKAYFEHMDNLEIKEIERLNSLIKDHEDTIVKYGDRLEESLTIVNIDDFEQVNIGNAIKTLAEGISDKDTNYKALAGELMPVLKALAA